MTVVIGVACEDEGHFTAATCLADHVLLSEVGWLDGILNEMRAWRGLTERERWYKYNPEDISGAPITINGQTLRTHGHINGQPPKPEARMWRGVLTAFCRAQPRPDAVILLRDLDGYTGARGKANRREGLVQVLTIEWPFPVIAGWAEPEVEAWHVAGFTPHGADEQANLQALRESLSFDPTTSPHRLTSHPNDAPTDAKRVLQRLCGDDPTRRLACLSDHATLRARGAEIGAADFLDALQRKLVPLMSNLPPTA